MFVHENVHSSVYECRCIFQLNSTIIVDFSPSIGTQYSVLNSLYDNTLTKVPFIPLHLPCPPATPATYGYRLERVSTLCSDSNQVENGESTGRTATFTLDVSDDEGPMENSSANLSIDQNSTLSVDSMKNKFSGNNTKRHFR